MGEGGASCHRVSPEQVSLGVMKRLVDAVLGLLFAQVCCEFGLSHRESAGLSSCSVVEGGGMGADKSGTPSRLLIIPGDTSRVLEELHPPVLSLQEGAASTLWCKFSSSVTSVHWYHQNPGGRLIHLFSVASGTKHDGRFSATTHLEHFLFPDHRLGDLLLCCGAQCSPGTCSLNTNPQRAQPPPGTETAVRGAKSREYRTS
ncbi:T cell receptor alpha variable 22 [Camelus dromedarius]|nr:T cell receptor alpha variable 22 [Camelus dromedarius]